jgi:gluconate 2-dehydrogenase gamma chain
VYKLTRRNLLKTGAIAASTALLGRLSTGRKGAAADSQLPEPVVPSGYAYFTEPEVAFLDAAVSRLIPADDLGPGAREAGVVLFLDRQMAGPYGHAETWYMQGPWHDGTKEQGYQLKLTPAELYRTGIKASDDHCRKQYSKPFAQLSAANQDEVLHGLEEDKVKLSGVPAKEFFHFLQQNTMEGFLADPIYGGNRNFIGWKLIGFPGPRYNYLAEIERYGERYALPVVGLLGREGEGTAKG